MSFYRVEAVGQPDACKTCGHGEFWDIVHLENGEPVAESSSWEDKEHAEEIADLMNDAYSLGESRVPRATCEWTLIEAGSHGYTPGCPTGEEWWLEEGCELYHYCHWCGGKIVEVGSSP